MSIRSTFAIAIKALRRHTLQTALTMLGMSIGVAAVLTMIALRTGAEAAIEQQVRAAGMNLIVVTAGNYKPKTEEVDGGVVDHQALRRPSDGQPARSYVVVPAGFHPEDDPMEKHDHPLASQRLGDLEAGPRGAGPMTGAGPDADRPTQRGQCR